MSTEFKTLDLEQPVVRGEQTIDKVSIRRPTAGEMRGVSLLDLSRMESTAISELIPRLTVPPLTKPEVNAMSLVDFMAIGVEIAGFLLPKTATQASPN